MLRILRHIAIALTLLLSSTPLGAQDVEPDFNDERRAPVGTTAEPVAFVPSLEYVEDSESTTIDDAELSLTSGSLIDSVVRAGTLGLNYCNNLTIQSGALRVALDLGETYNYGKATFTVDVSLKIEGIDSAGGVETVVITHDPIALSIDKDGPEQVFYTRYAGTNLANHDLVDVYRVTINSYTVTGATVQPDIRVTVSYDDEYAVDPLRPPMDEDEPVIYHGAKHVSFSENPVFFGWNVAGTCADRFPGYQLQILRLFNIEPSNNDDPVKLKAVVDWSQALTIEVAGKETPAQGMDVTLAEGTGWYIWRARPVGSIHPGGAGDARNWGVWTDAPEDGEIVEATNIYGTNGSFYDSCGFYFTQPDDTLNWVYSRALTEGDDGVGSRVAEAMTFMTPLGRAAQSQVRVAEDGTYMTANSTVDFQGRSTLSQMSAPVGNSTQGFFFRRNHFNVASDDPYSAEDFDDATNIDDPSSVHQTPGSASKYYNGATNEFGSQVPTVDGYPFARTILSTDGSSRPQEAGGIGKVFRIGGEGSNKERTSKIYYASASDKELIRLFGDEAPADSNVYKMLVTDPNKVTTVQWIAEGRVIATAYQTDMGDTIMVPLSHSSEPRLAGTISDTLRGNRSRGRNGSSAYKRYAFTEPTDITVRYVLNPDTLRAYGDCFDTCATCDYRVRLYIHHLDEADSTEVIEYNLGADPCGTGSTIDTTMMLTLGPGTFAIERRLQTNTIDPATIDSLNPYGRTYAEQFRDLVGSTMSTEIYADDSLSTIITHLNNGNLDSLYLYLGLDLDSLANYDEYTVTTECCEVTFPILSPDCGFLRCPEDFDEMSSPWTDHLYDKWGATYGSSLYGYFRQDADWGDYEDSVWVWSGERSPHQNPFDAMVLNMITDTTAGGDPLYDCGTLWGIWTGLVAGIEQLRDHPDDPGDVEEFNPDFYLLDMFLKAAGWFPNDTASKPFDSTSGNGWLQRPYRYLPADVLNDDHGCKAKVGYNAGWHGDADSAHRWLELYECWKGQRRENKTDATKELGADCDLSHLYPGYPTTLVNWDSLSVAEKTDSCKAFNARKIESDCQTICEDRRQEFAWEIYRAYDTSSSPISFQSALCAVEAIVDSCVNECDLTIFGSDPIDSVGTPAQWGGIQRVFNSRVEVSVPVDDGEVDPYCANDSATLTEDRSVAYEDLIVEHLNYRLAIYWRSNGGTLWTGFMDALREVAPDSIVNRITDSTVWVPPYDYDVTPPRFEIDSLCDLHYIADTVLWSEMYPGLEHPLVNHLNEMLDDLWGYEIDTGAAYVEECESHVAETIARRYEYHLIESDRNALVDEYLDAAFAFYNGSPVPVPVDDELSFRKNFYAPADFADTNFWAFRRWDDQNFTFSHVELYECADKIEVTTGLHGPSKTICSSGVFTSFYAKRSVRVECGSTTLASSSGPSAATKLDRYMFVPYTESYGQFYVDSLDFLTYQHRHYTFFDSTAGVEVDTFDMSVVPKRIFGTRFFVDPSRQLSYNACGVKFCPDICWRWIDPPPLDTTGTDVEPIPCDETAARRIRSAIDRDVRECVDQEIFELSREYDEKCGDPSELDEEIIVEQPIDYIHFTLYYYDRVGNLVRTVPPKGVDVLPPNATRGSPTSHTFVTEYDYDAEGRLVRTKSPDGGEARVWYDQLGRLRFSQDARLAARGEFAYTKFDSLGRVVESGISTDSVAGFVFAADSNMHNRLFPETGTERTYIAYDTTSGVTYLDGSPQQHLRNRVSRTWTDDDVATHYSYDAHGNIDWVAQEIPGLSRDEGGTNYLYQYLRYNYDLISGSVNEVAYNEDRVDEFRHRYSYDADNALTTVETSQDSVVWDRDARYEYYRHGGLRRVEIGEDDVQGLDFTWTADGRLKAINHPSLAGTDDPGKDGTSTYGHDEFAADSFAIMMHYHPFDYDAQGASGLAFRSYQTAMGVQEGNDLLPTPHYDGNISGIEVHVGKTTDATQLYEERTGSSYRYDQVGRLDSSRFHTFDDFNDAWNDFGQEYLSTYEYDANGNIIDLVRHADDQSGATKMDSLAYSYKSATSNQLDYAFDAVAGDNYVEDIENTQSGGNYEYDEIGNLIEDFDEGGMVMTWESGGRVKSVDHGLQAGVATSIDYVYDASGNRVKKIVTRATGPIVTTEVTYYVYDAAGTVVAIYEHECEDDGDSDNDGIPDVSDNCPGTYNPEQYDFDADGIGDACDGDADGDGWADYNDPCPWDPTNLCPQPNTDADGDGINDGVDNCPNTWNPNQADGDTDGIGDVCDTDRDNDGQINSHDPCPEDAFDTCPDSCATRLVELPIYGLSRVGVLRPDIALDSVPNTTDIYTRDIGEKSYELTDHLGNVRGVVSDRKRAGTPGSGDYYAEYLSYNHAYPYGMPQPGRSWDSTTYRYGFNGMETDPEVKDRANHHFTTHFRQYDPRIGRWWSFDPLTHIDQTPYLTMDGNPVRTMDPSGADGEEPEPRGGEADPPEPIITVMGLDINLGSGSSSESEDHDVVTVTYNRPTTNPTLGFGPGPAMGAWVDLYQQFDRGEGHPSGRYYSGRIGTAVYMGEAWFSWQGYLDVVDRLVEEWFDPDFDPAEIGVDISDFSDVPAWIAEDIWYAGVVLWYSRYPGDASHNGIENPWYDANPSDAIKQTDLLATIVFLIPSAAGRAGLRAIGSRLASGRGASLTRGGSSVVSVAKTGTVGTAPKTMTWGRNAKGHLIKHRDQLGFGHLSAQEAQKVLPELKAEAIRLLNASDMSLARIGTWNGQKDKVIMYISEGKMVVTKESGEFVTVIGKTTNNSYNKAVSYQGGR